MKYISALICCILIGGSALAQTAIVQATTLSAETANNTNATAFIGTTNGDVKPGSVSKLPLRSLLYAGATTQIVAHYQPWWGAPGHVNIGLGDEANPAVVAAQVADASSRGIDGFVIDYYGPQNTHHNTTAMNVMTAAEATPGFEFALCEDSGALKGASNVTSKLLSDIQYMADNYFVSPSYMRQNGRPVVMFFLNTSLPINWATVRAQAAGNPLFIFRNSSGFSHTDSDGSFTWTNLTSDPNDMGLSNQDRFYQTGLAHPSSLAVGSAYKGFNDTIASWGSKRIKNQQCGQTWLATWAEAGKYYSAANQLPILQIATWNDYEEGTEIESGIDNCVSISAAVAGPALTWTITGQENTLDHYNIYISTDGQNLMELAQIPAGNHSMDLSGYALAPGSYALYVEAAAKPGLLNHMSAPVPLTE